MQQHAELPCRGNNGSVESSRDRQRQDALVQRRDVAASSQAKEIDIDVSGIKKLILQVGDAGDGITHDHADWAVATITVYEGARPEIQQYHEPVVVLTPPMGWNSWNCFAVP